MGIKLANASAALDFVKLSERQVNDVWKHAAALHNECLRRANAGSHLVFDSTLCTPVCIGRKSRGGVL